MRTDKNHDTADCIATCGANRIAPQVARGLSIAARTTSQSRHPLAALGGGVVGAKNIGYAMQQGVSPLVIDCKAGPGFIEAEMAKGKSRKE